MPTVQDLRPLSLDLSLLFATLLLLAVDLGLPHGRKRWLGGLTALLLAGLLGLSFVVDAGGAAFGGAYVGGPWALMFKRIALLAGALAALGAVEHVDRHFPTRQGEFYLLLMFSLLGMTLLPGARDLLLFVVCFELMGIPLAMLASYAKSEDRAGVHRHGPEAGLKLYMVSAVSTAITLFGLSWVYGMAGTTRLEALAQAQLSPMLAVGMLMTLAGLAFKVGAVPFHMWVPDTYEGAPTPFVAFLSVAPKATGLAALAAMVLVAFRAHAAQLLPVVGVVAVASILVGNLLALPQQDVKRLLAYSGISQVGYMLLGLYAGGAYGMGMVVFFAAGYVVTNMGAFLVLEAVAPRRTGITLQDLHGLSRRSPWLATALLLFLLSLAGIPFAVGFWAKLLVFMSAYKAGHGGLVLFGALMAIVSLWYYLQVARAAWMVDAPGGEDGEPRTAPASLAWAILVCLSLVLGMGAWPRPFIEQSAEAASAFLGEVPR